MSERVKINLNPATDGIIGGDEGIESASGKYVIIGTNYEHRVISEDEYIKLTQQMQNVAMVIDDYMIIFDERKMICVDGDYYLVGSFILSQMTAKPCVYERLSEDDIEGVKCDLSGYMTDIIIDGERYSALEII